MLSHIIAIILAVLGILSFIYTILDAAIFKNNKEDTDLILILVGFLLLGLAIPTYNHTWIFSCALDELLI